MTFYQWLMKHKKYKHMPFYDLARDAYKDKHFQGRKPKDYIRNYLENEKHASDECLEMFDKAWNEYQKMLQKQIDDAKLIIAHGFHFADTGEPIIDREYLDSFGLSTDDHLEEYETESIEVSFNYEKVRRFLVDYHYDNYRDSYISDYWYDVVDNLWHNEDEHSYYVTDVYYRIPIENHTKKLWIKKYFKRGKFVSFSCNVVERDYDD